MQQTKPLSAMSQDFQEWVFRAWINRDESLQVLFQGDWTSLSEDERLSRDKTYRKRPSGIDWDLVEQSVNYAVLLRDKLVTLSTAAPVVFENRIRFKCSDTVEIGICDRTDLSMVPFKIYKRGE